MDAATINRWIDSIGHTYDVLVVNGLIPNLPLTPMLGSPDSEDLLQKPTPGITLWFCAETKRLEQVMITLAQTVGQPVYTGELPIPFTHGMDQQTVRRLLGVPTEIKKPVKLPGGLGMREGADTYHAHRKRHAPINISLGYLENLSVNNISFSLLTKSQGR